MAAGTSRPDAAGPARRAGQGIAPDQLTKPLGDSWPTSSGDYTGGRFSSLKQINATTVKQALARMGRQGHGRRSAGRGGGAGATFAQGGYGTVDFPGGLANIKGSPLMVDGTLYVSAPDNTWANDARDGRELWHYFWKTRGGTHIANRGLGIWNELLYMVTPDDCLWYRSRRRRARNAGTRCTRTSASSTSPPRRQIVIGNHVLLGTGNDLDSPGYMQSFDPVTGAVQWRTYLVPMNQGDPGLETWPSLEAARYGGAHPWLPGVLGRRKL